MKNNILTVFIFFSFLNGYSVFGHLYDAHSSAMGFAYASNIQNNKYNFLNPASNQLSNDFYYSTFGDHFSGIFNSEQLYISFQNKLGSFNLAVIRLGVDDIPNTITSWNDGNNNEIVEFDEIDYENISYYNQNELGMVLSYPFAIRKIPAGFNFKISRLDLLDYIAVTYGFDVGINYNLNYKLLNDTIELSNIAIVLKDILNHRKWNNGTIETKTVSTIIGTSVSYNNFTLNIDIQHNQNFEIYSGLEYKYGKYLSFMGGRSHLTKYSLGISIQLNHYNVSYSFATPKYEELGMIQKVTIGIDKNILSNLY